MPRLGIEQSARDALALLIEGGAASVLVVRPGGEIVGAITVAAISAALLKGMGFPNVAHLEPGFNGWAAAGLPVEGAPAKKG